MWVNDELRTDADRERLIGPVMFDVIGTNDPAVTKRRLRFLVKWAQQSAREASAATYSSVAAAAASAAFGAADYAATYVASNSITFAVVHAADAAARAVAYAAYATARAASRADAAEHIVLPAIKRLAAWGEKREVPQVRTLESLPFMGRGDE
jgi:arginyl-tRNA synthetase